MFRRLSARIRCQATRATAKVASAAEEEKACKYAVLGQACFVPVAIETVGVVSRQVALSSVAAALPLCTATDRC